MARNQRIITCARCKHDRPHKSRGLCNNCDFAARRNGTVADYPTVYRRADELLDDYRHLRARGLDIRDIAERLHMRLPSLRTAIYRARARGDRRAAA